MNIRSVRYDSYCFAPLKVGVAHYGKTRNAPIEKDIWYPIAPMYKEAILRGFKVTTSADLAAASLKFALMRDGEVILASVFADKSIATAVTSSDLALGSMFTTYKPTLFTFGDVVANTPAITTIDDFSTLDIAFQVSGAVPPDALVISFEYQFTYKA